MLPLRRSTVNSLRRVRNFETRARRIRPPVDAFDPDADQWLVEFENYSSRPVRMVPSAREPIGTGKPSKSPLTPLTARPHSLPTDRTKSSPGRSSRYEREPFLLELSGICFAIQQLID